jgi:ADP-ribosylation factor GTPase-activating protein 2/3
MGGKKGLGAQKLNANFSAIEKEAESIERSSSQPTLDDTFAKDAGNEPVGMSARLMVRDLDDKKKEEQLKRSDPKKYEQSERLGMAKGTKSAVHHSVFAEMKPIQQEGEKISGSNFDSVLKSSRTANLDDDWEVLNTEPSKSSRDTRKRNDDFFDDYNKPAKDSSTSSWGSSSYDKNRNKVATNVPASSEDAQKKFGNAKAISSDQFFGDQMSDFQSRSTFNRFEGQSAISSSDFFGSDAKGGSSGSGKGYNISTPDVAEIKDSVRQGVTKVAGKLSQLSNSVSSYMSNYNN